MFKAFIVRPFRPKNGIDFAAVQAKLIEPAMTACDIQGGTTEPFLQAGNIRADMFQQLLVADIVIADISIHNANVFYELGIRHALRPRRTFLLRAKSHKNAAERGPEDEVPFDLRTDRYLEYDPDQPENTVEILKSGLLQTLASDRVDSPGVSDAAGSARARSLALLARAAVVWRRSTVSVQGKTARSPGPAGDGSSRFFLVLGSDAAGGARPVRPQSIR
jgi:hypothetical protein